MMATMRESWAVHAYQCGATPADLPEIEAALMVLACCDVLAVTVTDGDVVVEVIRYAADDVGEIAELETTVYQVLAGVGRTPAWTEISPSMVMTDGEPI